MTADIVNLRRFRKQKQRAQKAADADANRARHGLSKAERTVLQAEQEQRRRALDGAERDAVTPVAANEAGFSRHAEHEYDDLDPGNVS